MNFSFPKSYIQTFNDITYDVIPEPKVYELFGNINDNECIRYAFDSSKKLPYMIDGMPVYSFVDSNLTFIMVGDNKPNSWFVFRHCANIRHALRYLKYFDCESIETFCKIVKLCKEEFKWTIQGNFEIFDKEHLLFNYVMPTFVLFPKIVDITTHSEIKLTDQRIYEFYKELVHDNINWTIENNDNYRNYYDEEIPELFQIFSYILYAWDEKDKK